MEELSIDKKDAVKAYKNTDSKGKSLLEDLFKKETFIQNVMDRIKTIDDVLEDNGTNQKEFDNICRGLDEDEVSYKLIKMICKSLNEDWIPDLKDSNQSKYTPYFKNNEHGFSYYYYGAWTSLSTVGLRLCLKSSELAKYAGTQFSSTYEPFILINEY